jgi:hypothetical protein
LRCVSLFNFEYESKPRGKHARKLGHIIEKSDGEKLADALSLIAELKKLINEHVAEIEKLKNTINHLNSTLQITTAKSDAKSIEITTKSEIISYRDQGKCSRTLLVAFLNELLFFTWHILTRRDPVATTRRQSCEHSHRPRPLQNDIAISCVGG